MTKSAFAACVLLLAMSGCRADPPDAIKTATPSPPSATAPGDLRVTMVRQTLGTKVGPPQMDGETIVFPANGGPNGWREVHSVDLRTHQRNVLAHTGFAHGMINWAARAGSWTVYVDQSGQQSDAVSRVAWQVVAVADDGDDRIVLASSAGARTEFVPQVRGEGGAVLWSAPSPNGVTALWWWKPGWPKARHLIDGVDAFAATPSIDGADLVYLGPAAAPGNRDGADCWRVPLTGGEPEAVTRSGRVSDCTGHDGWLLWREYADPSAPTSDPERQDDPYELWAKQGDQKATRLHQGYMPATYPYTRNGTALWIDSRSRPVVQDLTHPERSHRLPRYLVRYDPFGTANGIALVTEPTATDLDTARVIAVRSEGP